MRHAFVGLVGAAAMLCVATAMGQTAGDIRGPAVASQVRTSPEEQFFRIEWQMERAEGRPAAIVGSLSHDYAYPVQRVRLQAQVLDDAGQITHEALGTMSDVPPRGRGAFRLQLPATGARYVITVHSFEFGAIQSP